MQVALILVPSVVVAVIFALPMLLAVTTPVLDTVATLSSELFQETFLFVAEVGVTVALSVTVSLTLRVADVLFNEMPVAGVA